MRLSSQEVRGLNGCRTRRDRYDASRRRDERRDRWTVTRGPGR